MFRKTALILFLALSLPCWLGAQTVSEFKPVLDSMQTLLRERTSVASQVKAKKVVSRDGSLDFYLTNTF